MSSSVAFIKKDEFIDVSCIHDYIITYRKVKYFIRNNSAFKPDIPLIIHWHTLIRLVGQIYENSEENKHILGMFIDPSKDFDAVDHKRVLRKMEMYGIGGIALKWFEII